jgi:hypothetical protein
MKHQVVITIIIVLAVVVILIVFLKPEWIQHAWLWVVGLVGSLAAIFKRGFQKLTTGNKIRDIKDSNQEIKDQILELQTQIQRTRERHELESKLYQKDIDLLQQRIQLKDTEIALERKRREIVEKLSWQEYYNALSDAEKNKIQEDQDLHTIDVN